MELLLGVNRLLEGKEMFLKNADFLWGRGLLWEGGWCWGGGVTVQ